MGGCGMENVRILLSARWQAFLQFAALLAEQIRPVFRFLILGPRKAWLQANEWAWFLGLFALAATVTGVNEFGLAVIFLGLSLFGCTSQIFKWEPQGWVAPWTIVAKFALTMISISAFICAVAVVNEYRANRPWSELPAAYVRCANLLVYFHAPTIDTGPRYFVEKPPTIAAIPPKSVPSHHVSFEKDRPNNPCIPKTGRFYSDPTKLPGGPKLQRPELIMNFGSTPFFAQEVADETMLYFELVITNRGEASIVKGWELCLVVNGKTKTYQVAQIPVSGVAIPGSYWRITRDNSLVDNAIRNPIDHAHTAGGWVVFKMPGTLATNGLTNPDLVGTIVFRDYLDHKSTAAFARNPESKVDFYVPGAPN
jgi:hypothetical protein